MSILFNKSGRLDFSRDFKIISREDNYSIMEILVSKIKSKIKYLLFKLKILIYGRKYRPKQNIDGKNNIIIMHDDAVLIKGVVDIQGDNNLIEIKKGSILNNVTIYIRGNNHKVTIGEACRFNGGNLWFEDHNCSLVIGDGSSFEDVYLALTEPFSKITIGSDCMFAYDIDVRTGDSNSIIFEENKERINYAKDITIGNHVWIAAHYTILKGSSIPENSVVATRSVITKSFNNRGTIIGGNPAKVLKEGITWLRERIYNV